MTYAFVSQRGYYPHQLRKPNQDAWRAGALLVRRSPRHNGAASRYVCASLNRDANAYVLGVFDGHGAEGDLCASGPWDIVTDHVGGIADALLVRG